MATVGHFGRQVRVLWADSRRRRFRAGARRTAGSPRVRAVSTSGMAGARSGDSRCATPIERCAAAEHSRAAALLLRPSATLFEEGVGLLRRCKYNLTHGWDLVGRPSQLRVQPQAGRLCVFFSQEVEHEVLPSKGERLAITLWIWSVERDDQGR